MTDPESQLFHTVSRRVVFRLFLAQWFCWLGRTAVVLYPIAAAVAVGMWLGNVPWINVFWAGGLVAVWVAATGLWAWLCRPSPRTAMAYWDENAGRNEMFISAYCFESQEDAPDGERLHLARAAERLHRDLPGLPRDVPAPLAHRTWILPLLFVGLVGLLLVPSSPADEPRVDEADRQRARKVADTLADRAKLLETDGLTPEEKEKIKKLESSLDETADELRKLDDQTQRDVLARLEEKAHLAEKLAEALDELDAADLSSKMLAELARHADTTDFASSMQSKNLDKASREALKLTKRLDRDDLTKEVHERIEHALESSLEVATKADKQGLVGKHLKKAHTDLKAEKPKQAADKFRQLSKHLDRAQQRQAAQQRLQQLAQQLRNSGQQIFGQNPGKIQRLGNVNPAGLRQLGAQQLQAMQNMTLQQRLAAAQPGQLGQAALAAAMPAGQNLPLAMGQAPIPGSGAPPAPGNCPAPMPGSGQCPIPGTGQCPGGQCAGQGLFPGQGAGQGLGAPVPGSMMGMGAGNGGHFAGHGTAGYGNTPTNPLAASGTGVVNATPSGEGPSQVRNVEPKGHREETMRRNREMAIDFIKTQEEALAEEPLPLSRQQQVLRYFTALRRQLVEQP